MLEQTVATRIQVIVQKTTIMGIRCRLLVDQWNVECKCFIMFKKLHVEAMIIYKLNIILVYKFNFMDIKNTQLMLHKSCLI